MLRWSLVVMVTVLIAVSGIAADWNRLSQAYYGSGQQVCLWKNGATERLFLADSLTKLYVRTVSDSTWNEWAGERASHPRAVAAYDGHDTLLISRWGNNIDTIGILRCDQPYDINGDFDRASNPRNLHVHGLYVNLQSDETVYAASEHYCNDLGCEGGYQWDVSWGSNFNYVHCDNDSKDSLNWREHEVVFRYDMDSVWYVSRTGEDDEEGVWEADWQGGECSGDDAHLLSGDVMGLGGYVDNSIGWLFAGIRGGDSAGIWRSLNYGSTWDSCSGTSQYDVTSISCIKSGDTCYVVAATDEGLIRSADTGRTWSAADSGIVSQQFHKVYSKSEIENSVFYAMGDWMIYRSEDYGLSWEEDAVGLQEEAVTAVAENCPFGYFVGGAYSDDSAGLFRAKTPGHSERLRRVIPEQGAGRRSVATRVL